ncbi:hypothetical protein LSAT2_005882 [Lamellibrachia satsuma]|nr:hypothetical protein LSAT2_005882 [Lamellibrachia satsuma]
MGRKEKSGSASVSAPPVDQYRKQIGKQQWKTNKEAVKEEKRKSQAKKSTAAVLKDIVWMLVAFVVLMFGIYALFYMMTSKQLGVNKEL